MKELLNKNVKTAVLLFLVAIGVILVFLSDYFQREEETDNGYVSELSLYGNTLEEKFSRVVEGIDGTGKVSVMITFEGSFEKVYANNARVEEKGKGDDSNDKTTEKQLVLAGSGTSGEAPVLLKELCPKVKGVAVICGGADNKEVERKIREAAVSLFGISELKVYVAKSGER